MDDPLVKRSSFPETSYADWRRLVQDQLGEEEFENCLTGRADGADFESLCTATHPARREPAISPGYGCSEQSSGEGLGWVPCQSFGSAAPETLNHHLKSDLQGGVKGVRLRWDRSGRQGFDPMVSDGVGSGGAGLYRKSDLERAFQGVPSDWRVLNLDAGGCFFPATAVVAGWLGDFGGGLEDKTLLLGADPLGGLASDGSLPATFEVLADDLADLTLQSTKRWQECRAISVGTEVYREAGAEIDQELAISLATGVEYLRCLENRGVPPEQTAAHLAFMTSTGQQIFPEIAKLRALRSLWSRVLLACDVEDQIPAWIHSSVLQRNLPTREPSNNLLRATAATWAAVIGGSDSFETACYDGGYRDGDSDRGRRLARNTQMVLGLEGQVRRVRDPAAGSYLLETLTETLIAAGWELFQQIETRGGLLQALESGWLLRWVQGRWLERRKGLENGEIKLTGINAFPDPETTFESARRAPDVSVIEGIRRQYAKQAQISEARQILPPTESTGRWQWCVGAANKNHSLHELVSGLYGKGHGLVVEPFLSRRDTEPFESEATTP